MPNYFGLRASRLFSLLLLTVFSLAILVMFLMPIEIWVKAVFVCLLLYALVYYLRRYAWLSLPHSYVAIRLEADAVTLITRAGLEVSGTISRDSLVTPLLSIVNVLPKGRMFVASMVVFPDSLARERFRELRVLLKWRGSGE